MKSGSPTMSRRRHQQVPWHEMLDFACGYADWQETDYAVKYKITEGLRFLGELFFTYDPGGVVDLIDYREDMETLGYFNLSYLFGGNGIPQDLVCNEASSFLALLMQTVGVDATCEVVWTGQYDDTYDPIWIRGFRTQPLDNMGAPNTFDEYAFSYHQVCDTSCGEATDLWDAAASYAVDPNNTSHNLPAYGWSLPTYWQNWIYGYEGGLVVGYAGLPYSSQVTLDPHLGAVVGIYQGTPGCNSTPVPNGVF